ncbi:PD-(D/E)XK nuclease family protein [Leucobacter sp. UT-8R-CII-1-4]|uniref:UrvD/REP family ATP-dependent DNA helicase n=1 Tax=Leucobacter sp. UT-8R-CII-1-4 TaxID=3040075 RepID=UPI0024A7B5A9|nr:UrvD/REP family ATP-dependent DNA helicase [Leucobacter sp. UT-8R-CII-1-4]MDI6023115.1 PD-(D/E)XK nuclease family protein [Leucobacter sp. UT-8R-CII-1-4]
MSNFDTVQQQVFELDPAQHARVLGAPGTGKTRLLAEVFTRAISREGWNEEDVLVLAPNRIVAAALRSRIERALDRALGGTFVRTAPSLAFAILQRQAALRGEDAPRLLTGTAHDEAVERAIEAVLSQQPSSDLQLTIAPEVLLHEAFRAETRELSRVLDDFNLRPAELITMLQQRSDASLRVSEEFSAQWIEALLLLSAVQEELARTRQNELSSSAMQRLACVALRGNAELEVPRLVLVDDAGELGEGGLALLAALAERGTKIWVFGDPDIATGAFHGERTRVMSHLSAELTRKQQDTNRAEAKEQCVLLETVYRHGQTIRGFVGSLSSRVGTAGAGRQRKATASGPDRLGTEAVRFASVSTVPEQLGVIAHRLRAAHLGLAGHSPTPWSEMAVICRSRSEVKRVARVLAGHQVPSSVAAGGIVLREHQLVRELIRLTQHALGILPCSTRDVLELLGGTIGGLDPISLRRLKGALRLQEVRAAQQEDRHSTVADELILEFFMHPGQEPALDLRGARRLHRLGKLAAAAETVHNSGGTPREVLWQIWQGSGLADELQQQALDTHGARSDEAHRALDAVVGLFFALQRHEEQDSDRPIELVLEELLVSNVPEDSLAARSERDVVTIATPQGVIGREFDVVCVLGVQDGNWPNLRARGSMLGVTALERWLRGEEAARPSRRDTVHDELRLFLHAVARARQEALVVAVASEDLHPSVFFTLGEQHRVERSLPSSRLTLRGMVAEMRRRLVVDPTDTEARDALVALAQDGVPGASPNEWYGILPPSSVKPIADIENDPEATISVSPSQMERAEECPLDWIVSRLAGGESDYRANIGTLLHQALDTSGQNATAEDLLGEVEKHWKSLKFEAEWQADRAKRDTVHMAESLASYLRDFERSGQTLLAHEASFMLPIEFARLRGDADRIEARAVPDGGFEITVVDLKTGRRKPTASELEQHAQLQSYQLGVLRGAFVDGNGEPIRAESSGGAKLLYVHPDTVTKTQQSRGELFTEIRQDELSPAQQHELEERVLSVARTMAAASFTAQLEHHCTNQFGPSRACSLHIIPAVSHS